MNNYPKFIQYAKQLEGVGVTLYPERINPALVFTSKDEFSFVLFCFTHISYLVNAVIDFHEACILSSGLTLPLIPPPPSPTTLITLFDLRLSL